MRTGSILIVAGWLFGGLPNLVSAADILNGQKVYAAHCVGCHGANGRSVMPIVPSFSRGERLLQPDTALLLSIRSGRNAMPGYMGILADREILDVIAFLRTLR